MCCSCCVSVVTSAGAVVRQPSGPRCGETRAAGTPAAISPCLRQLRRPWKPPPGPEKLATCLDVPHFDGAPTYNPHRCGTVGHPRALERAKAFLFSHFERIFVVL